DTDDRVPGGWDLGDWTIGYPGAEGCRQRNSSWHGTHVAGTAGAQLTDNAVGMAGVAYNARILPVRVLGHCGGYESDITDAIIWAAGGTVEGVPANPNPAHVINLSLGGEGPCSAGEAAAIAQANALGAVVVVAAGNESMNVSNASPANCPGVIAVAANGVTSRRAYYSNFGAGITISAPGGGVYANDGSGGAQIYDGFVWQARNPSLTTPTPLEEINPVTAYGGSAGTSQAAPHVAGVVALMQGARLDAGLPLLTPEEVTAILQSTVTAFTVAPGASQPIGPGIVNAAAAVAKAIEPPCEVDCDPDATPIGNGVALSGLSGAAGSEVLYSIHVPAGAGPLSITTSGGSGDVTLLVSLGEEPTEADAQYRSARPGNNETVRVNAPQAGTYYIKLVGARAYSNVRLVARHNRSPHAAHLEPRPARGTLCPAPAGPGARAGGCGPGAPWKAGRGRRGGARPVGASRRSGGTWWRVRRVPSAVHRAAGGRPAPRGKLLKSRPPTERPAVNAIPDPVAAPEVRTAEDRILAALLSRQQLKDVDLARARRLQEET